MRFLRPFAAACGASFALSFAAAQNVSAFFDLNVDGFIDVPSTPDVTPRTGITIEAWITYDESQVPLVWRFPTIVRQGDNSGNPSENYFLRIECGQNANRDLRWKLITTNGAAIVADYFFAPGEFLGWTHVAATYDGAFAKIFVNGAEVASVPGNGLPIRSNGDPLRIGKGSVVGTPIEVWNGDLDEVRLWPFARTAIDIQSTMNLELSSVPGRVATWNLNGNADDSSNAQNGAISGQVTFSPSTLVLTPPPLPLAFQVGSSTPGCLGDLRLGVSGVATPGETDYSIVCGQTPPGALALWAGTLGSLPAPFSLFGCDIWLDPTVLATAVTIADPLGSARLAFPLPASVPIGVGFSVQCLVLDPPCAVDLFTSSDALSVIVL